MVRAMINLIDRQTAIDAVDDIPYIKKHPNIGLLWKAWVEQLPSAQPTLYGYQIEHLALIARVMEKEGVTPEKAVQIFADIGSITEMLINEMQKNFEEVMKEWEMKLIDDGGGI